MHYLQQAANLGNSLVVGINTDASVAGLGKDSDRPFNCLEDRLSVIASLRCVNGVIAFAEETPLNLILKIKPDVLVKGGDWAIADIVGAKEVGDWGGEVQSIAFKFERSTTDLIKKIRSSS